MYVPDISNKSGLKFILLADAFEEAIKKNELEAGYKLPPQRLLAYKLGVTVGTVTRAYRELEQRGLTEPKVGSGTYVKNQETKEQFYAPMIKTKGTDLSWCRPLISSQPQHLNDALISISQEVATPKALLGYYSAEGLIGHCQTLQEWLSNKYTTNIDVGRLLWTYGGQHGLTLIIQTLSRTKDTILVEGICYPDFIDICHLSERKVVPVKIDGSGIVPEDLELHCKRHNPKFLYITPQVQNPTGVQLNSNRQREIIDICRRYNVMIIEDDVLYCPPQRRRTPFFIQAPDITLYVGSFSKYFAGGVRIGFLIIPHSKKNQLIRGLKTNCLQVSPILIDLVCRWLANGTMQEVDQQIASELDIRHKIWNELFADIPVDIQGYNVWLPISGPCSSQHFCNILLKEGVRARPAEDYIVGHYDKVNAIRISLTSPTTKEKLKSALLIIRKHLDLLETKA